MNKRIAIKIGSNVLTKKDGTPDYTRMSALVDQIATLHKMGVEIIMISSGAVAAGRSTKVADKLDAVSSRQLFSAVGQVKLISRYYQFFLDHDIICGQVLTTKESLSTRGHYLNQRNCMQTMIDHKVIPIVNENDTISVTELMFTDNDELSGLIATMMDCQQLIILSNIDGIFDGNPSDPDAKVIRQVLPKKRDLSQYIQTGKSSFGRGGMQTKTNIASKVADEGIEVIIANGKKDNILLNLNDDIENTICTRFLPKQKSVSSVKKWIAHGFAKGEVHLDENATKSINDQNSGSVLLVGIKQIVGDFEKDDIVKIFDALGNEIGLGKASYSSQDAIKNIGQKGKKPFIHYDYLYIF